MKRLRDYTVLDGVLMGGAVVIVLLGGFIGLIPLL